MSSIIFSAPRTIDSATKIPLLGWQDRINLIRTDAGSYAGIRAGGAKGSREKGWYIERDGSVLLEPLDPFLPQFARRSIVRSEEHTSELQSLMRISYAVLCLKKKINKK